MTGGWGPLNSFRMGAGHQKNQGMIRGLQLLAPLPTTHTLAPPRPPGRGKRA